MNVKKGKQQIGAKKENVENYGKDITSNISYSAKMCTALLNVPYSKIKELYAYYLIPYRSQQAKRARLIRSSKS